MLYRLKISRLKGKKIIGILHIDQLDISTIE